MIYLARKMEHFLRSQRSRLRDRWRERVELAGVAGMEEQSLVRIQVSSHEVGGSNQDLQIQVAQVMPSYLDRFLWFAMVDGNMDSQLVPGQGHHDCARRFAGLVAENLDRARQRSHNAVCV